MKQRYAYFSDGAIWWTGSNPTPTFKAFDDAERLAEQFERTLKTDWFYDHAMERAEQLRAAMLEYAIWEDSLVA
jgi:hypothetical protein